MGRRTGKNGKKQLRRKQRKDTKVPQPSGTTKPITDEAVNEEHVPVHSNDPLLSGYVRLHNQSIEHDRLIGIGFVLDFVEFISFTFGDKEMILVIEAVSR
ncbi:hypothetical protein Tco_0348281 [Tanacetum coccineum]